MGTAAQTFKSIAIPLAEDAYRYLLRGGYTMLEKLGPGGEYLAKTLRDQPTLESNMAGETLFKLRNIWDKVPISTRLQVRATPAIARAQVSATVPEVQALSQAMAIRGAKRTVFNVATGKTTKVPYFVGENFFPTILTDKSLRLGPEQDELINHLITTGQVVDKTRAKLELNRLAGEMLGARGFEHMTDFKWKVPDKFLELDPIIAYGEWGRSASRYITKMDLYGPKMVNLETAVDVIDKQFGFTARNFALNVIDVHEYGYGLSRILGEQKGFYSRITDWEKAVRNFEGLTKLGRIGIAEPSQIVNPFIFTNASIMAKTLNEFRMSRQDAIDFTLKSGALLQETLRDFKRNVHGQDTWLDSMLRYTGFDIERKFNVIISANAGKNYAIDLTEKLLNNQTHREANYMLREMGLEPSRIFRQGGLTSEDLLKAGRRTAELTQFFHNPADIPIAWAASPIMRTAFLYKNFIWNQGRFAYKYLIEKSIATRNFNNLFLSMLVFPVIGELVGDAETLSRGENPVEYRVKHSPVQSMAKSIGLHPNDYVVRYLDNIARIGNIGMFYSLLGSMTRDNLTDWLGGPVVGDITDLNRVGNYLIKGDYKKAAKLAARRIPVAGPLVAKGLE